MPAPASCCAWQFGSRLSAVTAASCSCEWSGETRPGASQTQHPDLHATRAGPREQVEQAGPGPARFTHGSIHQPSR